MVFLRLAQGHTVLEKVRGVIEEHLRRKLANQEGAGRCETKLSFARACLPPPARWQVQLPVRSQLRIAMQKNSVALCVALLSGQDP